MRRIAQEHFGLDLESVTRYVDDTEDVPLDLPDRFDVRPILDGRNLEEMLLEGDLEGAFYPALLESVKRGIEAERIFVDSQRAEQRYYEETGIFPLMHTVVVRDDVLERHPWVAVNVYEAFAAARDDCLEKIEDPRWTALVWARQHLEHQQSILGKNPWPFGMTPENERALDTLLGYATDQGFIPRPYDPEELFVPNTLDDTVRGKAYVSTEEE